MGSRLRFRFRFHFQGRAWAGCVVASLLGVGASGAQSVPRAALATVPATQAMAPDSEDGLRAMGRIADVIFAGQVLAIRRHEAANGATGVVEIQFAVDDAIRGVGAGTYTMREWGGLWAAGYEPFRVGERYLMLLHAPGAAGLSSPVGGSDGAIPIRGDDDSVRVDGPAVMAAGAVVDLRWVATRAVHALSDRAEPVSRPASQRFAVRADSVVAQVDVAGPVQGEVAATETASYSTVLAKLRSWEKSDRAAR